MLLRASLLLALVLAVCGHVTAPASAQQHDAIAIGDSVMLGAITQLRDRGIASVDAEVSRQASTGAGLVRERGADLPQHVVVHLGSNGIYSLDMCRDLVRAAGSKRTVYLVTIKVPRAWEQANNEMLRTCDRRFRSDRVVLVDWNALASANPTYLYSDGVHLRPEGAKAFARLIERAIRTPAAPYTDRLPTGVRG